MRRRIAVVAACLVVPAVFSGCIGAEGKQAQALLERAAQAQSAIRSERFVVRFDVDAAGEKATMAMQGGAYLKGRRAGDFYFTMTGSGAAGLNGLDFRVMRRGSRAAIRVNGRTQRLPVPAAERKFGSPTDMLELGRYVKSVSVDEADLGDRPADRIVGKLDTQALLGSVSGLATKALGAAGVHFGDIRAVLFIPRDTHLMEVMFADMDVDAGGHSAHMHISIAASGINKPVAMPLL
jgi:hypothetical protein